MEKFEFKSLGEFYQWKERIERETCSSYVKQRGLVKRPNGDFLMYFNCNRSGEYIPNGKGLRKIKTQQSSKIGSKCASSIRIKVTDYCQRVIVKYSSNHDKHLPQMEHLRLPQSVRASIAGQLKDGVSERQIISAIQDVSLPSTSNVNRIFLIKRKDIFNIKRDFNIKNKGIEKQNLDAASLKLWANKIFKKASVNNPVSTLEEPVCKNITATLDAKNCLTNSLPILPASNVDVAIGSPVTKAQMFIELYKASYCEIREEEDKKIHELLDGLINICSKSVNYSTFNNTDASKVKNLMIGVMENEENMVLQANECSAVYSDNKPTCDEGIFRDVTEELFDFEEVFEDSIFYENMVKDEDIVELDEDMLDEVLNIHTEFDHSYL